jgi:pilus assembly protein CpaB
MEEVLGRPVVSPIEPDEPVMEARLGARGSGAGLSPMIPPGMRAISVRVNDVVGVSGFVLPGMRVDVLVTGHPQERDDTVTATVLQNVPVLSAGTTIQADPKSQPISATVVTLLVTPAQAEALTLANVEGKIQLVLRNSTDQQVNHTAGRHLRELYSMERPAAEHPAPAPESAKPPAARPKATVFGQVRPAASLKVPAPAADEMVMIRGILKTVESFPAEPGKPSLRPAEKPGLHAGPTFEMPAEPRPFLAQSTEASRSK